MRSTRSFVSKATPANGGKAKSTTKDDDVWNVFSQARGAGFKRALRRLCFLFRRAISFCGSVVVLAVAVRISLSFSNGLTTTGKKVKTNRHNKTTR